MAPKQARHNIRLGRVRSVERKRKEETMKTEDEEEVVVGEE